MKNLPAFFLAFMAIFMGMPCAHAGVMADHQGRWLGEMTIPHGGPTIKFGAELFMRADGSYWASGASPDQDGFDLPVKHITETPSGIELEFPFGILKMRWRGEHFLGEYRQHGTPEWLPLDLRRVTEFPRRLRPQTPLGPLPYEEQTLSIAVAKGVTLGATLSLPRGRAASRLVVLVNGSGPANRDEDVFGHRTFLVLADYLARQGLAVLRYDKRGISRSTGDFENHTESQLVDDLDVLLTRVRARNQFSKVGLVGHSQGASVASAVAARHPAAVDFLVSLAGVGLPGVENTILQDLEYARDQKATPEEIVRLTPYLRGYYDAIMAHAEDGPRLSALKLLQDRLSPADKELIELRHMNVGTLSLDWVTKPFLRPSLLIDPRIDWRRVRCPVLALNGGLDHQVPGLQNLAGITDALRLGGNSRVESSLLPSLNHMFQSAMTGSDEEYAVIEETMSPIVLERITQFVLAM